MFGSQLHSWDTVHNLTFSMKAALITAASSMHDNAMSVHHM